ncbi:hypothetical protein [Brevibacillus sp. H7]|uniref:hypothetical protein n=1 Tax=Brevibacillus sp. H7 TaxID=3349138 RepID=UPI00382548BE
MYKFLFILLLLAVTVPPVDAAKKRETMTITVAVSPDSAFVSTLKLSEKDGLPVRLLRCRRVPTTQTPELIRATIAIGKQTFVFDTMSHLFETKRHRLVLLSPPLTNQLTKWVERAEQAHFGRLLHWEQVRKEFRRMSYATVIDLETGEQFRVQRRAGSRHADVQPLTSTDTKTMKRIYHGKWSWKRRAILVRVNGSYYAASMHGMPHGAGAIAGNQFPGHFCIHFYGSSTHLRKEPDPSHSLMIVKASGKLPETVMNAAPQRLVDYFLTSLNENDPTSLKMIASDFALPQVLSRVTSVRRVIREIPAENVHPLTADIRVRVDFLHSELGEQKSVLGV